MDQDPAQPDRSAHADGTDPPVTSGPRSVTNGTAAPTAEDRAGPDASRADSHREHHRGGNRNITAVVLIVVGAVLLAGRTFGAGIDNWWALFILIPAFGALSTAWRAYQKHDGEVTNEVMGPGVTGIVLLVVAGVFLFDLDWSLMGGVVIILIGAALLIRNRSKQ